MTTDYKWQKFETAGPPPFAAGGLLALTPEDQQEPLADARSEGYDAGYQEGLQAAAAETEALQRRLGGLIEEVGRVREEIVRVATDDASVALQQTFRTVFLHELRTREDLIATFVDRLTSNLADKQYHLAGNPEDVEWLQACLGTAGELVADADVLKGSLRAVTQAGFSEIQIERDLDALLAEAFAALERDE